MDPIRIIRCFAHARHLAIYMICLLIALNSATRLFAQISPPGLSDTRVSSWMAVGLDQSLDKDQSWQSFSYIGYGFMSNPAGVYNLFEKPSMMIVNQEIKRKLTDHFSATGALSYRWQYRYQDAKPFHKADPSSKKEFRVYGKLSYNWKTDKIKWNIDFRPEYRKFFLPSFDGETPRNALRARFKLKSTIPLANNNCHFLILSAESLFQNEKVLPLGQHKGDWTGFFYDDSRFCLYYRYAPAGLPLYGEIGYMNNLAGKSPTISMHHLGLDIVFKDLF